MGNRLKSSPKIVTLKIGNRSVYSDTGISNDLNNFFVTPAQKLTYPFQKTNVLDQQLKRK